MTHYPITLRLLSPPDADAFIQLRRAALEQHPWIFAASPGDDLALSIPFVKKALDDTRNSATFGAFMPKLVGTVGIRQEAQAKMSHKARLWGMYVSPSCRRAGIGSKLLLAAIDHARQCSGVQQIQLSVSEQAEAAIQLYEKHGFETWGIEPNALSYAGKTFAERHMVLNLQKR